MKLFVLVPAKDPQLGKSRLAGALTGSQRRALNLRLARRTIETCIGWVGAQRTVIATSAADVARLGGAMGACVVLEGAHPAGLNAALVSAARHAIASGAEGLMVVPTDLPRVSAEHLSHLARMLEPSPVCVLVPDGRERGTNVLALAPARADLFRFGPDSLRAHAATARKLGWSVRIHRCEALALDVDLPADLAAWRSPQWA
jgi:2-phospho-L-lactate/phosphoenolpyruvate guanylyltransferase